MCFKNSHTIKYCRGIFLTFIYPETSYSTSVFFNICRTQFKWLHQLPFLKKIEMINLFVIAKLFLEWITSLIQGKKSWSSWFNFEFHEWNMLAILSISHQYYNTREKFIHVEKSEERTARAHVAWVFPFYLP